VLPQSSKTTNHSQKENSESKLTQVIFGSVNKRRLAKNIDLWYCGKDCGIPI
jgi:hypothetical protein